MFTFLKEINRYINRFINKIFIFDFPVKRKNMDIVFYK